jgi:enolase-phosphatase E1
MSGYKVYLLDVEGTVAPLSLTSAELFPYARKHFAAFIAQHINDPAVRADLAELSRESREETESGAPCFVGRECLDSLEFQAGALEYVLWLMDRDRKSTALMSLQGKIWKAGFESGELKGTLFDDVPRAFARWTAKGRIAIYSSGSTAAQQQFFRHSKFGDLTPLVSAYFDTRSGYKTDAASYAGIAAAMQVDPQQICFFSDVVRELDAARFSGLDTRLVYREGNPRIADCNDHVTIESFDEVQ